MTSRDIALLRLHNQQVTNEHIKTVPEVVGYMGAMQAQDYYNALWALGVRTGQSEQEIIHNLEARTVIRTWPQRGTLHFVSIKNARWQIELSAERQLQRIATRHKNLSLTADILVQSQQILRNVLKQNNYLTRPQALSLLEAAGIATAEGRGYHILWYLSQTGTTYVGPMQNKQQTFGLLDELVPRPKSLTRENSIIELAKRYFTSHGPATLQDFIWWAGLTATDAKLGLVANESMLTSVSAKGRTYWMAKNSTNLTDEVAALLLPGFDEFFLGYKDRSDVLSPEYMNKVAPGGNGMFLPMIVLRGQIIGTWKRTIKKDHVLLKLSPFEHLSRSDLDLLQKPAQGYGTFLGLPPKIEVV